VELDRDALWPPNHKMATIGALVTVTDACDPNPTFVLTSITSNEPDNGTGDGDTENDIQEADYGTADTEFLLRSERAGGLTGRKYTIIYTASDQSGNTANDTTCVTVPHDQSGHALASSGFNPTGTGFSADAAQFRIVVLSRQNLDVTKIDTRHALVGNSAGVVAPRETRVADFNGDRIGDLELLYDIAPTLELRSQSTKKDPIGLHWHTGIDDNWLVSDIFALGAPMVLVDGSPEDKTGLTPEMPNTGDEPDQGGNIVVGSDTGRLSFKMDAAGPVQVDVFTVTGRKVRTLVNGDLSSGDHDLAWDGVDDAGRRLPSGIYFYRVRMPERQEVIKIRMVR